MPGCLCPVPAGTADRRTLAPPLAYLGRLRDPDPPASVCRAPAGAEPGRKSSTCGAGWQGSVAEGDRVASSRVTPEPSSLAVPSAPRTAIPRELTSQALTQSGSFA